LKNDENLILKVSTNDLFSDPNIFISLKNQNPDSFEKSEYSCSFEGKDVCTVCYDDLKNQIDI
jgi:hypothetical protein